MSDSRHLVDPALIGLLDLWPAIELTPETLPLMRMPGRLPIAEDPATIAAVDSRRERVPGPAGAPEVPVWIHRRKGETRVLPCIVHIHGGGYIAGSAESMAPRHRALVLDLDCQIVSIDYRLAPETPFPGAIEDCHAALVWVFDHAAELGIDPTRIGVMGESAGGGLAAALCLLARDRGQCRVAFQHLIYPMLDDRTCTATPDPLTGEFVWTRASNHFGWASLLGQAPGDPEVSFYAAAARATDLTGLPPAFISVGALDLFLDEDLAYARALMRAGVPTELHVYPGAFHAFELAPQAEVSQRALNDYRAALQRFLHPGS